MQIKDATLVAETKILVDGIRQLDESLNVKASRYTIVPPMRPTMVSEDRITHEQPKKAVPVYTWGVKFNGNSSVIEFVERIEELC